MMKQLALPLEEVFSAPRQPRALRQMHAVHGVMGLGRECRGCLHLQRASNGNSSFWKCTKYRVSAGTATDWRLSWEACGLWEDASHNAP